MDFESMYQENHRFYSEEDEEFVREGEQIIGFDCKLFTDNRP